MDDQFDAPRRSLLDVVQEKLQKQGKTVVISRLVCVGSVDSKVVGMEDVLAMHEDVLAKVKEEQETQWTGMLVVFPNCFVHVLEAPTKALLALLGEVNSIPAHERPFTAVRVISSTEDIPARAFPKWCSSFVHSEDEVKAAALEGDALVEGASEVNLGMIKAGKQLAAMSEAEQASALDDMAGAYLEVPSVAKCLGLVASDAVPSVADFLDIFATPVDIDLDSENVWPMPVPITFG